MIWEWVQRTETFDGEDFDHPHPLDIPVTLSHCEMTTKSFYGHSNTEWPQNEGDDAGIMIFSSWYDG